MDKNDAERLSRLEREVASLKRLLERLTGLAFPPEAEGASVEEHDGDVHTVRRGALTFTWEGDADPADVIAAGERILAEERGQFPFTSPPPAG